MKLIISKRFLRKRIFLYLLVSTFFTACSVVNPPPTQPWKDEGGKLKVVASTSIIFDIVRQVGGDLILLDRLLPLGADPHSFEPTPQDIAKLSDADVLFINGAGLETFLDPLIESSGGDFRIEDLSRDIQLIYLEGRSELSDDTKYDGYDPHVWMDPNNVILWVKQISYTLSELDRANASIYEANATIYRDELATIDDWIIDQVKQISPAQRNLITDHMILGYFSKAYGLNQVGAILPSFSTLSQPSAQEIAKLQDTIREMKINAIFIEASENPDLANRIAEDTGVQLVYLYVGSLTELDGDAPNYLDLIRYDVNAIVSVLQ